jgi:hypothetical protein
MATSLKSLVTPQDPIQELIKKQTSAKQDELAAEEKVTALETKKAENEAIRTAEREKTKVSATEELTAQKDVREAPIKEQKSEIDKKYMNAHFEPSQENMKDQAALFSLISVIGFAIGAGGKQNAMQAMSAMNGMLEGHRKGREDVFKQEQIKFDKNLKELQSKSVFLENELRHSLEDFNRDKRAADERAAAAFAQAGADFLKTYAEKNGYVAAYERAKEYRKSMDKAVEGERLRKEKVEDKLYTDRQHYAMLAATRTPKETPQEKREAKIGTAGPQYTIYQQTGKMLPDAKTATQVQANVQGIRTIEELQQSLRDPEVRTGLLSKTASFFEKVGSLGSTDFETAVNKELTGTDKTTLFLKKALLASYAIERAAKGGQRLTVQDMKMVGPVLDPTNYKPETYNELLDDRRRELFNVMQDYGFDNNDIKKMVKQPAYSAYGSETPAAAAPATQDNSAEATRRFGAYEPDKYNYGYEGGKFYREKK